MKVLTLIKKRLFGMCLIALAMASLIFAVRIFNDYRYGAAHTETHADMPIYMKHPSDLTLYPTEVEGVSVERLDEGVLQGFRLTPKIKASQNIIITYGGSEGSPGYENAVFFARHGYESFALFYFGAKNLPPVLSAIPLENFQTVLDYLKAQGLDSAPLTLVGASKGAEYALNLASKYHEIDSLILFEPSCYNFAGLDFKHPASSWSWAGSELPYISFKSVPFPVFVKNLLAPMLFNYPVSYKPVYASAVANAPNQEAARVPLKDVRADILMFAGEDDQLWDSASMGQVIKKALPKTSRLVRFQAAGHIYSGNGVLNLPHIKINTGGTADGNQAAEEESRKLMLEFVQNN